MNFDDIRPYNDQEVKEAMQRMIASPLLPIFSKYIFPDKPVEYLKSILNNIHNADEFQLNVIYHGVKKILDLTTKGLKWSGFDTLDKGKPYLFISNHRDIVLDSALLDWVLIFNSLHSVEITFGNNLLFNQEFKDFAKSNKSVMVVRGGNMRDMLENSKHLSEYIREAITGRKTSMWIAQRNGRTKDGLDTTDQGIIKMLSLSASREKSPVESIAELNIMPMAISYELEPCDILKAREILLKRKNGTYVKAEGEDKNSVLTGVMQPKGHIHMSLGKQITMEDLSEFSDLHVNNLNHEVAVLLDKRIRSIYHLMPTNYIAHDILSGKSEYSNYYTAEEKIKFEYYVNSQIEKETQVDHSELKEVLLKIYSTCVDSFNESNI